LDSSIKVIIIDECSMVSVDLFNELLDALPNPSNVMFIFIGDIQQLPPTFGLAILGFKLTELPVIELTEVYRQALDSPIIFLAHRVLKGTALSEFEVKGNWAGFNERLQFNLWPKKLNPEQALLAITSTINAAYDSGAYQPDTDIILCPFNKSFGTIELNRHIANHVARVTGLLTFEIIAGWQKTYFSIGDRVLYDKEDATIINITVNPDYIGQPFQDASYTLDYWGYDSAGGHLVNNDTSVDKLLELAAVSSSEEQSAQAASHCVLIRINDSGQEIRLENAGQIKNLQHSYAMTVHKSQGSEWRKVILVLHHSHACMIARELLYTAITRAREQLIIVAEKDTFMKGITNQRIKGNTIEEKAAYCRSLKAIDEQ
jgi:exodeoxyribonuclease V alpha subunit